MHIKRELLFKYIFSIIVFVLSCLFYPLYIAGDQAHYRAFYDLASSLPIGEAFFTYQHALGSSEPGYFLLVYFLSGVMSKDFLFSFVNAMISFLLVEWMLKKRVSYAIIHLMLVNFYMLVLFFAADRLKVGALFLLLAAREVGLKNYFFSVLSLLSHIQMLLPLIFLQLERLQYDFSRLARGFLTKRLSISLLFIIVLAVLTVLLFEHLARKLVYYIDISGGWVEMLKPLVFLVLSIYYAKNKTIAFLSSIQLVLMSFVVGADRLVIFSYILFMYHGLQVNRGINLGVLITSLYFSFKGFGFIRSVFVCGEAFSCFSVS